METVLSFPEELQMLKAKKSRLGVIQQLRGQNSCLGRKEKKEQFAFDIYLLNFMRFEKSIFCRSPEDKNHPPLVFLIWIPTPNKCPTSEDKKGENKPIMCKLWSKVNQEWPWRKFIYEKFVYFLSTSDEDDISGSFTTEAVCFEAPIGHLVLDDVKNSSWLSAAKKDSSNLC